MIIEIFNFSYYMDMNCGFKNDIWRYHGQTNAHRGYVSPSRPVDFDEKNLIIKTFSGKLYQIMDFDGNKDEIIAQIKLDILNKSFERF